MRVRQKFLAVDEGYAVLKRLKQSYGNQTKICVSQHPGLGDAYLAGLYLNRCYDKQPFVVTAIGGGAAEVYRYLGVKNVHSLTEHETNVLVQFCHFMGMPQDEVRILHHQALLWHTGIAWNFQGVHGVTFADLFERMVFPELTREDRAYPEFVCDKQKISEWEQIGIKKGESVILFPKANTLSPPPVKVWEQVAELLRQQGKHVFTYAKKQADCLNGTGRIFEEIAQLVGLAGFAGTIIGARSGLMDILGIADCKKVILYPQMGTEDWITGSALDYWSINRFGYCSDAIEMEWNEREIQKLAERIVSQC